MTPPMSCGSETYRADRRRDPTPINMPVIARAFLSSFIRALRSPPERGVQWCFGAIRTSKRRPIGVLGYVISKAGQHPSSSRLPVRCWHVSSKSRCATRFQIALAP